MPELLTLATPCAACPHPYNWHGKGGCQQNDGVNRCDCIAFATPGPAASAASGTARVLADITAERRRQDARWGVQNHPDGTGPDHLVLDTIPVALAAHAARELCQRYTDMGIVTWRDILTEESCEALAETDPARLRAELVQVAAVCAAWAEAIDRRTQGTTPDDRETAP
ncbi:hypothetical protein ACWEFL_15850 [Streptomyces sp. NPDC004838]